MAADLTELAAEIERLDAKLRAAEALAHQAMERGAVFQAVGSQVAIKEEAGNLLVQHMPLILSALRAASRVERVEAALREMVDYLDTALRDGCWVCSGDCGAANPPVLCCPVRALADARALLPSRRALDPAP